MAKQPIYAVVIHPHLAKQIVGRWCTVHGDDVEMLAEMYHSERFEHIINKIVSEWLEANPYPKYSK